MIIRILCVISVVILGLAPSVQAQELAVSHAASADKTTVFDLDALDALEQISFTTSTIWTDDPVIFSGVPLRAVLDAAGLSGNSVALNALNDYVATLPMSDVGAQFPIVATRLNGQKMSVRDYGPYWIVYPYDSDPVYQSETVYSRSVWQLRAIAVSE